MKTRNYLLLAAGAALVGSLVYVSGRTVPIGVDLTEARRGPMQTTVNADGKTRLREVFDVATPISGTTRRSPVEVGDPVIEGETVVAVVEPVTPALLDSRSRIQAEAAVHEAEAALRLAQTEKRQVEEELAYAQSQFDRVRTLVERGVASTTQLEDATQVLTIHEAALDAAQSGMDMAQGSLDRARAALLDPAAAQSAAQACCVEITAPASGTVLSVNVVSETPVAAGTALLSLGDVSDLEIVSDLLSSDAVLLSPGARASVERWGGAPLAAELRALEPVAKTKISTLGIEEQRVNAVFDFLSPLEARAGLGDGYAVFLRIVTWEADDVLQVPLSTLFRSGEGWAVFVMGEDGLARLVPVEVGARGDTHAQILGGLESGARLIMHPPDEIADGSPIEERLEE